jgi:general secretion pathway protein L
MSQLLVTLEFPGNNAVEFQYAIVSNAGQLTAQGRAVPALLPKTDTAALVLPASALSWHLAALPKLQRSLSGPKLQAVLAGVLEEQLLDDPAQLHLVAFKPDTEGKAWVAACEKAWLKDTIETLQKAGVPLTSVIPVAWPHALITQVDAPAMQHTSRLHAHGPAEAGWFTYSDAQGVLSFPLNQPTLLPAIDEGTLVTAEPAVAVAAEMVLQQNVSVLQAAQYMHQAAQGAQARGINLAQGDVSLIGQGRRLQQLIAGLQELVAAPAWRAVRWGMALLLLANVIGLNAWAWKAASSLQDKRAQMNQLLTQSFPNVKVVVDAPVQMQRELLALRQAQGELSGRDFESIYGRFSAVVGMNTAPSAIEFIANEVAVRGGSVNADQLQSLQGKLQYAGLAVRSDAQRLIISHQESGASP